MTRKRRTKKQRRRIALEQRKKERQFRQQNGIDYAWYIQSTAWESKRQKALRHYNHKCSVCSTKYDLQVHHKTYDRLGRELVEDLEVLCAGCHANKHEDKGYMDYLTREYVELCKTF